MKKLILFLFALTIIGLYLTKKPVEDVIIPGNAIRFRIIANSNNFEDQEIKMIIKDEIIDYMKHNNYHNMDRSKIIESIKNDHNIEKIITKYTANYDINYGFNYFPDKKYNGINYKSGNYESLVITLGSGLGDNWWRVLYPPLCFVDENNTEYKSIVKEIINNI